MFGFFTDGAEVLMRHVGSEQAQQSARTSDDAQPAALLRCPITGRECGISGVPAVRWRRSESILELIERRGQGLGRQGSRSDHAWRSSK